MHYYDKTKRMNIKQFGVNIDGFGNVVSSKKNQTIEITMNQKILII